jgi:hypothetical protein
MMNTRDSNETRGANDLSSHTLKPPQQHSSQQQTRLMIDDNWYWFLVFVGMYEISYRR